MLLIHIFHFSLLIIFGAPCLGIREILDFEEKKFQPKKSCRPTIIRQALVLPFGSGNIFDCNLCSNNTILSSIWFFLPSNKWMIVKFTVDNNIITILPNGNLLFKKIKDNGTLFCQSDGIIRATYSITTTILDAKKFVEKVGKPLIGTEASINFQLVNSNVTMFRRLDPYHSTKCMPNKELPGASKLQLQVSMCFLAMQFDKIPEAFALKYSIMQLPNEMPCYDFNVHDYLDDQHKYAMPHRVSYRMCDSSEYQRKNDSVKERVELLKNVFQRYRSNTLVVQPGESLIFSCPFSANVRFIWEKRLITNESLKQILSPLFIARNSGQRMRIDFRSNLLIDSVEMNDYQFIYVCSDESGVYGTFKVKMQVENTNWLEMMGISPDNLTMLLAIIALLLITFTIMGNPDVQSKQ